MTALDREYTAHNENEEVSVFGKEAGSAEIAAFLSRAPFVPQDTLLSVLKDVPANKLEEIAKAHPGVSFTVYDVLLAREGAKPGALKEQRPEPCAVMKEVLETPNTPYCKWKADIFRFTELTLEVARKLSAVIRKKYAEVKADAVAELLSKLESIARGRFKEEERKLALVLLNTAVLSRRTSPMRTLHICSVLRQERHGAAESTLEQYLEGETQEEGEGVVVSAIRERRGEYAWYLQVYLKTRSSRVQAVYAQVKETIHELVGMKDMDQAVLLLKPIYIHSTDELEKDIENEFKENAPALIKQCRDTIWS
ncbi:hypothetical protein NECID01_1048 [Nematocida sp. AWRm77]|nr:hypothetical protein NECID01_1048 [Nematocida sp. AWRm77]